MPFFLQRPRGSTRRCPFIIWTAILRFEALNVSTAVSNLASPSADKHRALPETLPLVRVLVRDLLAASPSYLELNPGQRRQLAASMVQVCEMGASLLREEHENRSRALEQTVEAERSQATSSSGTVLPPGNTSRTWSFAQNAGTDFSGVSAQKVAGTTQAILNAVSFPRFVTDLINGVFKAMISSSTQQMNAYVELLNNVSSSLSGSADSVPSGNPETSLLPFARIQMARQRQQMLATMVMLGMQRIVVDSGKINASMRFHIDTRSAAQDEQGSTFNFQNTINASGSYGVGPWGVSASVSNTIGYVSTQKSQTTEEMNTDLDLNSSVEINFRSDYLPLNRMASSDQASRIRANTLNPETEAIAAEKDRAARNADLDKTRWQSLDKTLQPQSPQPPPAAGAPGTVQDAEKARDRGNADAAKKKSADSGLQPTQKPADQAKTPPPSTTTSDGKGAPAAVVAPSDGAKK